MPKDKEAKQKSEVAVNCAGCNKHLKKVKRYYRNGKYYCSKTCWKSYIKKTSEKSPEQA
ncbi:MAG: hypothetical protein Q8N14_03360 [Candidatus Omnitrophota bacterium]|nr:hypothetical protein [Candidatus Omnitrophota bacterium]